MATSAWTAAVWGGAGRAHLAEDLARQGHLTAGHEDEECWVCRNDVLATVLCKPCDHKVCVACVENLRAKNIFKVRGWAAPPN